MDQKFYDAESFWCFWKTEEKIYLKLIPEPLEADDDHLVFMDFIHYPRCKAFGPYMECAIYLGVKYKEKYGLYCLSMPLNNDMAMAAGREWLGFPKKMASITINTQKNKTMAFAERKNVRFITTIFDFLNSNEADKAKEIKHRYIKRNTLIFYNFRDFPTIDGKNHFHLIKIKAKFDIQKFYSGNPTVQFGKSIYDNWGELKVMEMLGAFSLKGTLELKTPNIFKEVDADKHRPFAFLGWDL